MEYKKSFAYHIEVELGLDINKVWNFEKNIVNPYEITKQSNKKVWLYCLEKDYHNDNGGYEVSCNNFYNGNRCSYCGNMKTHSKDSFAQWGIDTFGDDFLEKYWSDKNTLDPWGVAPGSDKKIWILCQEKDYHNDDEGYETSCYNFHKGKRCSYCKGQKKVHPRDSFAQWGIDNIDKDFLKKYWSDKNTLDPWKITNCSGKKIWILCQEKDYHNDDGGYEITCANFHNGKRCSYCHSKKIHRLDSLGYLYPQIAQMIIDDERNNVIMDDMYKVAPRTESRFYFKCDKCGKNSSDKKSLSMIVGYKFSCEYCSDGISIPEKFTINILKQLDVEIQTQLAKSTFEWCKDYRYDFYIPALNTIIETHGLQHYENCFECYSNRTLEEEQENDRLKKELALNNNIDNYIVIDCRYSKFDWLKENIIKELGNHFDLSDIDWKLAWEESQKSLVWETKRLYDLGYNNKQIAEKIGICDTTVTKYKKLLNL